MIIGMKIEHNEQGFPAVDRNVENGLSSQLTDIDDVGGTALLRRASQSPRKTRHNLTFSRTFVSASLCTSLCMDRQIDCHSTMVAGRSVNIVV